jgi:hypothetical protein
MITVVKYDRNSEMFSQDDLLHTSGSCLAGHRARKGLFLD